MNNDELKDLIHSIDASSLNYFEMENSEVSIKMSKREVDTVHKDVSQSDVEETNQLNATDPEKEGIPSTEEVVEEATIEETDENSHIIKAPIVGTSYLSSSPEASPFAQVGDKVTKGQTIFIIEAMKVMNEIKSDTDGIVKEILVEDGQAIEFNQPLIKIETE